MATDYFGQKQAEIMAQQQKENEAHRLRIEAAARMDKESREHLRDVIIPFFEEEAKSVATHNAFLHIEKEEMRGDALPARIQVTLKASNHDGARSGWPILISVSPSLTVTRRFMTAQPSRPGMVQGPASRAQEQIDVGTRVATDLDHDGLGKLFRMMVDEFFGSR